MICHVKEVTKRCSTRFLLHKALKCILCYPPPGRSWYPTFRLNPPPSRELTCNKHNVDSQLQTLASNIFYPS